MYCDDDDGLVPSFYGKFEIWNAKSQMRERESDFQLKKSSSVSHRCIVGIRCFFCIFERERERERERGERDFQLKNSSRVSSSHLSSSIVFCIFERERERDS